ncbi:protein cms1 [Aspergillus udagawae]|uniref:Protein cms1 n=1 Tax=Aspergillus udagawae TaxID=91492 RepID=A0ABQ1B771_9EURO|nr:protein cms1 [Aspergillus udagawae]GFF95137.1 protein cms1 [Aspergillus udagawae]GFG21921.1 protein cms1 [Aspergillus udagawae]
MSNIPPNPSGLSAKVNKKRKRQAEEAPKEDKAAPAKSTNNNTSEAAEGPQKKKKKNSKNKQKQQKKKEQDDDPKQQERKGAIDESIGKMDGRLLADHFVQKAKRHNKELTAVELGDLSVPDSAFLDTSSFESPRSLDQLPAFLKAFSPNKGSGLSKASEQKGTPHTLVVCPAALRAADVVRALRTFQSKDSTVGKLFAKHIKLEEAKQFLQRARTGLGVGTPARISDLIDAGSLKLDELERIVIDGSYIDQKQRGIFDMKETHLPLLQLLTRSEFRERYGAKQKRIQILVF